MKALLDVNALLPDLAVKATLVMIMKAKMVVKATLPVIQCWL